MGNQMKILFLYKDQSHARPVRTASTPLRKLGIELEDHNCRTGEDCRRHLSIQADLLVAHQDLMKCAIEYEHGPILVCDRIDGAQLAGSRDWLDRDNVVGVIKSYRYKPAYLNNQYKGRYLAHLLHEAGVRASPRGKSMLMMKLPKQVPQEKLNRIFLMPGFAAHGHQGGCEQMWVDWDRPRRHDAHFRGTMSYSGSEVETHRNLCMQALASYKGAAVYGASIHYEHYLAEMLESRTVVSPWGCGEPCHRDYEAMLLGAVLIKPQTDHVDCWPDIYRVGFTYVACNLDFSDLHDKIRYVCDNWDSFRERRIRNRELVIESRTREYRANRLAESFRRALA